MPRPERVLDPDGGPVESLAAQLRALRQRSGNPGYRELAGRAGYSVAALANAAGGRRLPSLAVTLAFVRACGDDTAEWERRWRQASAESVARRVVAHGSPAGADAMDSPYRGLMGYSEVDARRFFGRRTMIERLLRMVDDQRFVAVFGASGSGKSSLLRAGLVPAWRDATAGGQRRPVLVTPGPEPVEALRKVLAKVEPEDDVLLVVDQFEELFTLCSDPAERAAYVAELNALAANQDGRIRVVIGVRADFFGRCAELPDLAALLTGRNVPLGPLSEAELSEVITEPARQVGLSVERALVTKILSDTVGQPGALPLMSHALLETWRHRRSDVLTLVEYESVGGVATAVSQTAETVYQQFDAAQQATARRVLTRLVAVNDGSTDTKRRVNRQELDLPGVDVVLQQLADARLVVLDVDVVQIAHEALIAAWPRLYEWLHTDRETLRLQRRITEASEFWRDNEHDAGALYRGVQLNAWEGRSVEQLNPLERRFLAASRDRQVRETRAGRRRIRLALGSLTAGVVALSVLATMALVQSHRADDQRAVALSRQLVANAEAVSQRDQEVALLLARQAYHTKPIPEAQSALRQAVIDVRIRAVVPTGQGQAFGVAYRPDGRELASTGADGTVRLWDVVGPDLLRAQPRVLRGIHGRLWSPVFSPDGRWLAAAGDTDGKDDVILVWDLATDAAPIVLSGEIGEITSVAFSADGTRVASSGVNDEIYEVRIWDRAGITPPRVLTVAAVPNAVAFSPDGRYVAAGGNGSVVLWDAAGLGQPRVLTGNKKFVASLQFSPDSQLLASGGGDGTIVWQLGGTAEPVVLSSGDGTVGAIAFSPDGRQIASGSTDSNAVRVWSITSGNDPLVLRGHHGPVWSVAFSPDGKRLSSASADGTVRVWDPGYAGDPQVMAGPGNAVRGLVVSPRGDRLVSGGEDRVVRLWDAATGTQLREFHGHDDLVLDVALSPDGRWIASASADDTIRVWDTTGLTPQKVLTGHVGLVSAVAFSPDGQWLASGGGDGTVRIWDLSGRRETRVLTGHEGRVFGVAVSPDGRRVASSGHDGTVRIWPVTGSDAPIVLRDPVPGLIWAVAFSPDGKRVASSGHEGTVRIWNSDGHGKPLILSGHLLLVWSVTFSPDGQRVATGGEDGTLRIWRASNGTALATYRGQRSLTEQVRFMPDGLHLATAHKDGTVRRWDCEACAPIERVVSLADARVTRGLTPEERETFLGASP